MKKLTSLVLTPYKKSQKMYFPKALSIDAIYKDYLDKLWCYYEPGHIFNAFESYNVVFDKIMIDKPSMGEWFQMLSILRLYGYLN